MGGSWEKISEPETIFGAKLCSATKRRTSELDLIGGGRNFIFRISGMFMELFRVYLFSGAVEQPIVAKFHNLNNLK